METEGLNQNPAGSRNDHDKVWVVLGVIIVLAAAGYYLAKSSIFEREAPEAGQETSLQPQEEERTIEQDQETTLAAFPEGFPFEDNLVVQESYQYIPAGSTEQQFTIEYVSQKSLAELSFIMQTYLRDNGYSVENSSLEPESHFYYATKDGNVLSVSIDQAGLDVLVSATYLKQ